MASRRAESCRGRPAKWILLTFDKDGELARGSALPPTCGVVLLCLPMPSLGKVAR
jgi:hypothetical protein